MVQMFMRDLKNVSSLWSVHFRVSALERFCYKGFLRNLSGAKFFIRLREVSTLEDVRFREIPLYLHLFEKKWQHCHATAVLKIDSVYKQSKNYHPQVYVEECKFTDVEDRQCNMLSDDEDGFSEM